MNMKEITELFDFKEVDLLELHDRLWYEHFTPFKPLTKQEKDFIRTQLNFVGAEIKLQAEEMGNTCAEVKIVQKTDTFEPDEMGPNWLKKIYVDTAPPLKLLPAFDKRAKKVARDAPKLKGGQGPKFTDEDDDLLGDTPKAKAKPAAKAQATTGKSNYDIVSALADVHGANKDKIEKLSGLPRKVVTDNLWRWNKNKGGKK